VSQRVEQVALSDGWSFQFEDEPPQSVSLPHCWNATDTMDTDPASHYRRGRGTYTLNFTPPQNADGKRLWLRFGAVAQRGWVYFDGDLIGEHHGGYTAFTVEVPHRAGELKVVADNTPDPNLIPSDMSDFFLYGGITRPVSLYVTGENRFERVFFDVDVDADEDFGYVRVHGCLIDDVKTPLTIKLRIAPPNSDVPIHSELLTITEKQFTFDQLEVDHPELWSPDAPNLYTVYVTLVNGPQATPSPVDTYIQPLGFRYFDFPAGGPFYLNGEQLLLRGTHRHDDWAGFGAAVPRQFIEQEMRQIKDAGFNFIRLGHYPQADYTLHLCDSLGLIVWEELPWCRGGVGGETFKDYTRTMLREMIEQHYNYPSIVFWGLGNELDWESEHPDSTDEKVAQFLSELHEISHKLDPRRLTALRRFEQGSRIVDVYSPSIWSGWYRGRYPDYERVLTDAMKRYPRMLHIEWGGDSHIGRHNNGPHITAEVDSDGDHGEIPGTATSDEGFARYSRDGDWSESYMIDLMAHHLNVQARLPRLAGTAQWIFKDFGTPLRPENPVPYVNQKGLVARDGTPKDVYHVFRACQVTEPVVHIESSAWDLRAAGQERVRVITNCARIELFIDGQTHGVQEKAPDVPATVISWDVVLNPGDHTFKAVGDGVSHEIKVIVTKSGAGPAVGFTAVRQSFGDGERIVVQCVDSDGQPIFTDERRVRFSSDVRRHQGTMGGSDVVETANGRAWIWLVGAATDVTVSVEGMPSSRRV